MMTALDGVEGIVARLETRAVWLKGEFILVHVLLSARWVREPFVKCALLMNILMIGRRQLLARTHSTHSALRTVFPAVET